MVYAIFDYSGLGRGVGHGQPYSDRNFGNPINTYNWISGNNYIYSELDFYDFYHNDNTDVKSRIEGNFIYSSQDGSLNLDESTIDSITGNNSYGTSSAEFSEPIIYSTVLGDNYLYNLDSNIYGTRFNDVLYGGAGRNNFVTGQGDDMIYGGDGIDAVYLFNSKAGYSLELSGEYQLIIRDINPLDGDDGIDRLTGIEYIDFGLGLQDIEALRSEVLFNTPASVSNGVRRLYNTNTGRHLFSSNITEIDYLTGGGYGFVNEGISYLTPSNPTAEVYRFLVSDQGRHFYTANRNERDLIRSSQANFVYEGVAFEVYSVDDHPSDAAAVVRYYNSSINSHVYSTSGYEQQVLNQNPLWINEGVAWYSEGAI